MLACKRDWDGHTCLSTSHNVRVVRIFIASAPFSYSQPRCPWCLSLKQTITIIITMKMNRDAAAPTPAAAFFTVAQPGWAIGNRPCIH